MPPLVHPDQIEAALKTDKPVWSRALGRLGRIQSVDGNVVYGRGGIKGRGAVWCTVFHGPGGDDVALTEEDDKWVIRNAHKDDAS